MERYRRIEKLTENPFLNLYHMDAVTKEGKVFPYYFASRNSKEKLKACTQDDRPEGIAVYAVCKENQERLVMLRQFRYPLNAYLYELPAGLVEEGETPKESAIREMKEETGLSLEIYEGGDACFRNPFFLAQGLTDESGVMVYGYASGKTSTVLQEESEEIEVLFVDKKEARRILANERVSARAAFMLMNFIHADKENPFSFLE